MKKFTLLALAAMAFGMASADDFVAKDIHGLLTSDPSENADVSKRNYYKIQNMRAQRLNYVTKQVNGATGDSIGTDGAVIALDSLLRYFDGMEGYTAANAGKVVLDDKGNPVATPVTSYRDDQGKYPYAYMGLSSLGGNWWLSFSAQSEVKDPRTEFWWFEDGGVDGQEYEGSLWIHNAVMAGLVSGTSGHVKDLAGYNRANMDFKGEKDTNTAQKKTQHRYYLLPVKEAWEKAFADNTITENWVDSVLVGLYDKETDKHLPSLTEDELKRAYAFNRTEVIGNDQNSLDMNNYENYKFRGVKIGEDGDTIFNDQEARTGAQYYGYGFAGVDRTWSPLKTTSNKNHWVNNGTLFFFEKADASEAVKAIEEYSEQIAETFRQGAVEEAKGEMMNAAQILKGWLKLPAIWGEETHSELNALATYCESWKGEDADPTMVTDINSRDKFIEAVKKIANEKLAAGAALAGSGCKVKFMNMMRFDVQSNYYNNAAALEEEYFVTRENVLQGNSFVTYHNGSAINVPKFQGHGVVCEPDLYDDSSEWELVNAGEGKFYLKNASNGEYIMKHANVLPTIEDEVTASIDQLDERQCSWMTSPEVGDAAPFSLIGCPNDEDPHGLPEDEDGLSWYFNAIPQEYTNDLTNKVQLLCSYEKRINAFTNESITEYIHVTNGDTDYKVGNYPPSHNSWLAGSNTFQVISVEKGAISEVAAAEKPYNAGIYDLQGRKVAKAGKGLYIINGVKTLVK